MTCNYLVLKSLANVRIWRTASAVTSLAAILVVAACGGGGGDGGDDGGGGTPVVPNANGTVGAMPDYEGVQVKTVIPVSNVTPLPSQRATANSKSYFGKYGYPRSWAVADLNGDGLDDIVVAPTLFDQKPDLPVQVWLNKGDGTFENRTTDWFVGAPPTSALSVAVLVADFNGDGKPDLFIADSGQEECTAYPCPGALNRLFLSDASGKWRDASAGLANNTTPRFNHVVSSVGDLNGDGKIDIAVPTLGEVANIGGGVILQVNNGDGSFADRSSWLSDETGYAPFSYQFSVSRPATYDLQSAGATAIADVDGDGKPEFISCTYTAPDRFSGMKTIRFSRWNSVSNKLDEVGRYQLSGALLAVIAPPVLAVDNGTLGCAGVWVADIDKDGTPDLMVSWENASDSYVQLLKGKGGFQFDDVTVAALGAYRTTFTQGGFKRVSLGYQFQDVNGDGFPDIVLWTAGLDAQLLSAGVPSVLVNDGTGRFKQQKLLVNGSAASTAQVEALTVCTFCSHSALFGRFVRRTDSRKTLDLLLTNTNEDIGGTFPQERSISLRVLKAR